MSQKTQRWFEPYLNTLVGFVVKTRRDEFLPIIGRCHESPGDDDCFIVTVAKNERQATLETALSLLDAERGKLHRIFRRSTGPAGDMGQWLLPLVRSEETA